MNPTNDLNTMLRETRTAPQVSFLSPPSLNESDLKRKHQNEGRLRNRENFSHLPVEEKNLYTVDRNSSGILGEAARDYINGVSVKRIAEHDVFSTSKLGSSNALNAGMESAVKSEQLGSVMAHFVLEYVFSHELGGRTNAARGDEDADYPPPGRVAAERAQLRPPAKDHISYCFSIPGPSSFLDPDQCLMIPRVVRAILPENAFRYRQSLAVCDYICDTLGGVTGPYPPSLRKRDEVVVAAGLEGKKGREMGDANTWSIGRGESNVTSEHHSDLGSSFSLFGGHPNAQLQSITSSPPLHLFEAEVKSSIAGSTNGSSSQKVEEADAFSLDAYLNGSDSDE